MFVVFQDNTNSTDSREDASADGAQQSDFENVIKDGHQPIREGSDITRGQAVVLLMSFILRHQLLSGVAVGDLCLQCFDSVGWATGRASGL